ncbi:MAG TPA: YncE family protein [Candidatus Angelobacter sp.]|nr:YncE family protein [Candidatus Angelobacter sp.]
MTVVRFVSEVNAILCFSLFLLTPIAELNDPGVGPELRQKAKTTQPAATNNSIFHGTINHSGIAFDLQLQYLDGASTELPRDGRAIRFRLGIHDSETGNALTGLHPTAWMNPNPMQAESGVPCKTMVQSFLRGSLLAKRPALDLNGYYVATLNETASITVVDPQFTVGRPRRIAHIALKGRGGDWTISSNQSRLYVSLPEADEVDLIDTASWEIVQRKRLSTPFRIALQPDEHYLWVSYRSGKEPSGVVALRADTLAEAARFETGSGPHDIAFSPDSRIAFVTSSGNGTIATIDIPRLVKIQELQTHGHPASVAFSPLAEVAYVTDTKLGNILVIRPNDQSSAPSAVIPAGLIPAEPGITKISFPGDGRFGLVLNPEKGLIQVVDTSRNQIVQTGDIDKSPTQIFFSEQLAYIMLQKSDLIEMLPLDQVGKPGAAVPIIDLPGGPSSGTGGPSSEERAAAISQVPGQNAVVIASRRDKTVYYYDEGMAAPMGVYANFGEGPRSLLVIDRSFKETSPGTYETVATPDHLNSTNYILPIVLDNPQMAECFQIPISAHSSSSATSTKQPDN